MKITTLLFLFGLAVTLSLAQGADEYEEYVDEEPAPAPPPPPKPALRGLAAVRQARGPIIGRPNSKTQQVTKTTTTTTTEAPPEYEDEELPEDEQPEDLTTTTEAPKKGGITLRVRPFRSQESLIEALKRRRQQQSSGGSHPTPTTAAPPPPEKSSKNGRKSSSSNKVFSDQTGSDSQTKNTVNGRRFNPRSKSSARTEAPQEEQVEEEVQPTRSRSFGGRGRRF